MKWNHFCNFGIGYYEEKFCEMILNFDQWFRRCIFKIFLIWSSGDLFVQWSGTICAILVEGIKRNNSVKLFLIWTIDWFRRRCLFKVFLSGTLGPFSSAEQNHLCNFGRRHYEVQFFPLFFRCCCFILIYLVCRGSGRNKRVSRGIIL